MRLVPVDLADAAQHSKTGSTLSTEAPRVADVLMCTLVIERIGQQQNRLLKSEFSKKMLYNNLYILSSVAGYTLSQGIPRVEMPSSISGASLGLSGGWSSLRIPGLSSPDMSWSMGTSDISLRSEMDDTFRLDRMESDRLIAIHAKKISSRRNKIGKKKHIYNRHRDRGGILGGYVSISNSFAWKTPCCSWCFSEVDKDGLEPDGDYVSLPAHRRPGCRLTSIERKKKKTNLKIWYLLEMSVSCCCYPTIHRRVRGGRNWSFVLPELRLIKRISNESRQLRYCQFIYAELTDGMAVSSDWLQTLCGCLRLSHGGEGHTPAASAWIHSRSRHSSQSHSTTCRMVGLAAGNGGDGRGGRPFVARTGSHVETARVDGLSRFVVTPQGNAGGSRKATVGITQESRDLKEEHAGR